MCASGKFTEEEIQKNKEILNQVAQGNFYAGSFKRKELKEIDEFLDRNQDSQETPPPPQEPPQNATPEEKTPKKGWWEKFKDFLKKEFGPSEAQAAESSDTFPADGSGEKFGLFFVNKYC